MRLGRLLQHGLLPREEAEELVGSMKAGKCGACPASVLQWLLLSSQPALPQAQQEARIDTNACIY